MSCLRFRWTGSNPTLICANPVRHSDHKICLAISPIAPALYFVANQLVIA